jgi:hypothetical protein
MTIIVNTILGVEDNSVSEYRHGRGTGIAEVTWIMEHPVVEVEGVGKVGGYTKRRGYLGVDRGDRECVEEWHSSFPMLPDIQDNVP